MNLKNAFFLISLLFFGLQASAQKYLSTTEVEVKKEWKGQTFNSTKTFFENISEVPQFTILADIFKKNELQPILEKEEMVTIFAVTDAAFLKLPEKSRDSILGNTDLTGSILKFMVVLGRLDSYSLNSALKKNNGTLYLATLEGEKLEVRNVNGDLQLMDSEKRTAKIIASDFYHKNGFFHIVEGIIFPPSEE